jgi:hypothetical protein
LTSIHRRPDPPEDRRIRLHVEPIYERPEPVPCSPEHRCRQPECLPCLERDIEYLRGVAAGGPPSLLSYPERHMRSGRWTVKDVQVWAELRLAEALEVLQMRLAAEEGGLPS